VAASACPHGNETVTSVESALRKAVTDLNALEARWVLVGGLAVSAGPRVSHPAASPTDLDAARDAVKLIQARGFNQGQDVAADVEKLIADVSS
jgi:hypothetical protein